jgi:hypothetical protein
MSTKREREKANMNDDDEDDEHKLIHAIIKQ